MLGAGTDPTCYDNRELSIKDLRMHTSTLCAFRGVVRIPVPEKLRTLFKMKFRPIFAATVVSVTKLR